MTTLIKIRQHKKLWIAAGSALLLTLALLGFASNKARAATTSEIYAQASSDYCITPPNADVGAQLVIGQCVGANTQYWQLEVLSGNTGEIYNTWDGLCMTVNASNGAPDGEAMLQGNCAAAQTQIFSVNNEGWGGGYIWFMPDRQDYDHRYMALDDSGGRWAPYNPVVESYYCTTCASESWNGLTNS